MKDSRIFWGDLPLWRTARVIAPKEPRGSFQTYEGIDSLNAEVLPTSPNYGTELECHTVFEPYADGSNDYTKLSFRSAVDAVIEALTLRSYLRAPVCWIDDKSDTTVNRAVIDEGDWNRVRQFELQCREDGAWNTIVFGTTIGPDKELTFAPVKGQVFRLNILKADDVPTICELELFEAK